jgi:hypothetical protein
MPGSERSRSTILPVTLIGGNFAFLYELRRFTESKKVLNAARRLPPESTFRGSTTKSVLALILLALVARLTASAATQTIAFDAIPNQIFGASPFAIAARASSLLPVSFASTTPAICSTVPGSRYAQQFTRSAKRAVAAGSPIAFLPDHIQRLQCPG